MAYSSVKQGASNKQPPKNKSLLRKVSGGVSYTNSYFIEIETFKSINLNTKSSYNKDFDFLLAKNR